MKYAYDITVNFKKTYLDFFEWNKKDKIMHIRKIPIMKIHNDDLINMITTTFKIQLEFLEDINIKDKYICLFISEDYSIVCQFNDQGICILKSSLIVDEELDIIENYYKLHTFNIDYQIIKKEKVIFMTRQEQAKLTFLYDEIHKLKESKDSSKIKYLYFECFGRIEKNSTKALNELKISLKNNHNINDMYKFFKLIETNQ